MHPENNQTGVVNVSKIENVSKIGLIYDAGVANKLRTFAAYTSDHPEKLTDTLGCCRAITEATVYPKRPSSRRDTPYPRSTAESSGWCRK